MADNPYTTARGLPHNGPLTKYWTAGKGLNRWANKPHPYTALTKALTKEGVPPNQVNGLAAQYFFIVFNIWPGQRPRKKDD